MVLSKEIVVDENRTAHRGVMRKSQTIKGKNVHSGKSDIGLATGIEPASLAPRRCARVAVNGLPIAGEALGYTSLI